MIDIVLASVVAVVQIACVVLLFREWWRGRREQS